MEHHRLPERPSRRFSHDREGLGVIRIVCLQSAIFLCAMLVLPAQAVPTNSRAPLIDERIAVKAPEPLQGADRDFLVMAATIIKAEIALGMLASQQGATEPIKMLGLRMVELHNKAESRLRSMAVRHGLSLPPVISSKDRSRLAHLTRYQGKRFDTLFSREVAKACRHEIPFFDKRTESADPEVAAFAASTSLSLQYELEQTSPGVSISGR